MRNVELVAALVASSISLAAPDARADTWYGWQTLISDGATLATALAVAKIKRDGSTEVPAAIVAVGGYLGAPVVIHLAHEQGGRALASGALRVGAPLVGALTVGLITTSNNRGNGWGSALAAAAGVVIGLAVGIVTASTIDAAVLAYDDRPEPGPPPTTASPLKTVTIGGTL